MVMIAYLPIRRARRVGWLVGVIVGMAMIMVVIMVVIMIGIYRVVHLCIRERESRSQELGVGTRLNAGNRTQDHKGEVGTRE
jgi:hypothetical protein